MKLYEILPELVKEIPKELEPLAEEARKYDNAEDFGNNIPNYISTKTGKLLENISDPSNWKDLTIKELIDLKNNNPDFIVSAKLVSGGRGGVSRHNITIKNLLLPDNSSDFYNQATKEIKEVKPKEKLTLRHIAKHFVYNK